MVSKPNFGVATNSLSSSPNDLPIRCVVMRSGTSRGLFFHERDLPSETEYRDHAVMAAMGAPDPRQVDGLGGGDSLLSKACIVARSNAVDADVECEFANIAPGKQRPTWGTNCGNLVAAVAVFALDEGLVVSRGERPTVRIRNRNSGSLIIAQVGSTAGGTSQDDRFSGMTDTGFRVHLDFIDPVGTVRGQLLPSGNARDSIRMPNGSKVDISIVDAGAMYVFVAANSIGLTATETGAEMSSLQKKMDDLEYLRCAAAKLAGLVEDAQDATRLTPDIPKLAFLSKATDECIDASPDLIDVRSVDLVSRIVSSQRFHNAYAVTAAIATIVAASVRGSIVCEAIGIDIGDGIRRLRIGHPTGIMDCSVVIKEKSGCTEFSSVQFVRTARRIMEGTVFIPQHNG